MSWIADILTSGGIGSAVGAIAGIGQKIIATKMEHDFKVKEFSHIEKMHERQFQQDLKLAEHELSVAEIKADTEVLSGSYNHDASFSNTSKWVDNIRALVRPASLMLAFGLTAWKPDVFSGYLGVMIGWYFASRIRINGRTP